MKKILTTLTAMLLSLMTFAQTTNTEPTKFDSFTDSCARYAPIIFMGTYVEDGTRFYFDAPNKKMRKIGTIIVRHVFRGDIKVGDTLHFDFGMGDMTAATGAKYPTPPLWAMTRGMYPKITKPFKAEFGDRILPKIFFCHKESGVLKLLYEDPISVAGVAKMGNYRIGKNTWYYNDYRVETFLDILGKYPNIKPYTTEPKKEVAPNERAIAGNLIVSATNVTTSGGAVNFDINIRSSDQARYLRDFITYLVYDTNLFGTFAHTQATVTRLGGFTSSAYDVIFGDQPAIQ